MLLGFGIGMFICYGFRLGINIWYGFCVYVFILEICMNFRNINLVVIGLFYLNEFMVGGLLI